MRLREDIIKKYTPFIIKQASQYCGKYIEIENSEHFSIALIAFNEAIDAYVPYKNSSFINFASLVIQRRIINQINKDSKILNSYPFSHFENDKTLDRIMVVDESEMFGKIVLSEEIGKLKSDIWYYKNYK